MSIKNYIKKYIKSSYGYMPVEEERQVVKDHYLHQMIKQPTNTTNTTTNIQKVVQPGPSSTLTLSDMQNAYNSTTSSNTQGLWNIWNEETKKTMTKIGFKYNEKKDVWEFELTTVVEIKKPQGAMAMLSNCSNRNMRDEAIAVIKQAKKNLIEKLTAKLILMELTKPREIKE